ncbi:MAG: glycosyltransferase family 4 protein [Spirochaetales bacterium]|jgi:glycosyltransferase involved in cell wall biosynthesis|nr:glycosyltransferase family 4 protein [Spirochaetales bacterium]
MLNQMKVIHLIPYDGIGGVETAARSMVGIKQEQLDFQVAYIYRSANSNRQHFATFNPLQLLRAIFRTLSQKPDLLILSLWRSCIVGIFVKLLRPRVRLVIFLHFPKHVHWLDRFLTRLTARFATQIWADSQETLAQRLPDSPTEKGRVISFVTHHVPALEDRPVNPVFIFWGRIHPQKGIDRALGIFAAVRAAYPTARFLIIGPDGGDLGRIQKLANDMGLSATVSFLGGMDFNDIMHQAEKASFYLQTSVLEGMAMAVVEAMQLGLVPVVTPVGEIANYCRHGENALVVRSDEVVVSEILALLNDNRGFTRLRNNAVAAWAQKPLYPESVLQACRAILSGGSENSGRQV